jgi:hypothetical protein
MTCCRCELTRVHQDLCSKYNAGLLTREAPGIGRHPNRKFNLESYVKSPILVMDAERLAHES